MSHTVVGVFSNADEAKNAVQALRNSGFDENNVDYATGSSAVNYADHEDHDGESGISRFFRNLFGDSDESNRYSRVAKNGCVVTVHAQSKEQATRASEILDEYGAMDVDDKDREYDVENKDRELGVKNIETGNNTYFENAANESRKIPVIEENLQVGKKVVETGGVRLRSRIVEKPVEETIRLREEHVTVERNKVDRLANDPDFDDFEEGTVEIREHAEVPVISKDAKVVEEVSLDKTVNDREEKVRDKVRRTEVEVEDFEGERKRNN
jgi:stress response protein YsnF